MAFLFDKDFYPYIAPKSDWNMTPMQGTPDSGFIDNRMSPLLSPQGYWGGSPVKLTPSPFVFPKQYQSFFSDSNNGGGPGSPKIHPSPVVMSPVVPAAPPNSCQASPAKASHLILPPFGFGHFQPGTREEAAMAMMGSDALTVRKQLDFTNCLSPPLNARSQTQRHGHRPRSNGGGKGRPAGGHKRFYAPRMQRQFKDELESGIPLYSFCRRNGETRSFYMAHRLRNKAGVLECPILRSYVCPHCGGTGDDAHTDSYCPKRPNKVLKAPPQSVACLETNRNATGQVLQEGVIPSYPPKPQMQKKNLQ